MFGKYIMNMADLLEPEKKAETAELRKVLGYEGSNSQ